jgi:hypothetical protein
MMVMACTREQVFTALFELLEPLQAPAGTTWPYPMETPFKTVSRRCQEPGQGPGEIDSILKPALMMWEQPELVDDGEKGTRTRHWPVWLIIAFENTNRELAGSTILNPLLDAVEEALAPDDPVGNVLRLMIPQSDHTNLALVAVAYIEGVPVKNNGDGQVDGRGGALVAVDIIVP